MFQNFANDHCFVYIFQKNIFANAVNWQIRFKFMYRKNFQIYGITCITLQYSAVQMYLESSSNMIAKQYLIQSKLISNLMGKRKTFCNIQGFKIVKEKKLENCKTIGHNLVFCILVFDHEILKFSCTFFQNIRVILCIFVKVVLPCFMHSFLMVLVMLLF